MCEIAILDPKEYSADDIVECAERIYDAMGSSLGIVAAYNTSSFDYEKYTATIPDKDDVELFIGDRMDCWRFFIHGRLATHGDVTVKNAHPIDIDCDRCRIKMVMHNGMIHYHRHERNEHVDAGHEYQTPVDSEVIAHEYEYIPNDVEDCVDVNRYRRESAFILFGSDRIFIYTNGHYHLSEDGQMSRGYRDFGPSDDESTYRNVLISASE